LRKTYIQNIAVRTLGLVIKRGQTVGTALIAA